MDMCMQQTCQVGAVAARSGCSTTGECALRQRCLLWRFLWTHAFPTAHQHHPIAVPVLSMPCTVQAIR